MIGKILLLLAFAGFAAAALETCRKGGEYCLNHSDCCSGTCLSYLYKCSRILATNKSDAPLIASRFADDVPLSLNDLIEIVYKPPQNEHNVGRTRNKISSRFGRQLASDETTIIQSNTSGPSACKEIGEKCYFNEDCCSSRCHGFLHQCVT